MPKGIYKHKIGKKANAFKKGKTLIKCFCQDCGKKLSRLAYYNKYKRCKKCNKKGNLNGMFGSKRPDLIIRNKSYKMRHNKRKIVNKNTITKHHIDLNKQNNKPKNLLIISLSKHIKLHHKAYEYLVKTKQILKYIKWFNRRYKLNVIK